MSTPTGSPPLPRFGVVCPHPWHGEPHGPLGACPRCLGQAKRTRSRETAEPLTDEALAKIIGEFFTSVHDAGGNWAVVQGDEVCLDGHFNLPEMAAFINARLPR